MDIIDSAINTRMFTMRKGDGNHFKPLNILKTVGVYYFFVHHGDAMMG